MGVLRGILLFLILLVPFTSANDTEKSSKVEPVCLSRFDHDYKVIQKLALMEIGLAEVRETLTSQNEIIERISKDLKEKSHPTVAFSAQLSKDLLNMPQGTTVVFDDVILNAGNAYDPKHGVFTAMDDGIYFFSTKLSSPKSSQLWIMKNGVSFEYTFAPGSSWNTGSAEVIMQLVTGDRVWVEGNNRAGGYSYWPSEGRKCHHTAFTGFLISTM